MLIRPRILLATFVGALAWLALNAALDGQPTEHQAAQAVAAQVQAVALDHNQIAADVLFEQRVQRTGDMLCIRTAGPGTRAVWSGPDETLRCVRRGDGDGQPRKGGDRLMLAEVAR
ncbi:hypothetical protein PSQ39_21295 [Curvibacter sp. HBC28]|uniref:Uncharacterized protein n=1 Tax=Curvibacter microcysteis TaxID=3026419 RepID=A0ABT5MMT9_9BURK|nr:hypothetical protein [Curvibacter sp. HBC28]MDD0817184.1 hypothetical protein [Curvibacter sp. HBC28]